ncbi:MAG: elongation factor P-like protein YeiP [SAR86 cluster bacterium]|uniref:Elongation factor P-like protein n=1 Tax=SAR86 cluster bacterium TaxID=2030880 RepID=A0A2A5B309_9GAMM|nr:MAG: elongation factor P-like protein YeiP [SAR86 cluster bacterium]
MPKANELKRGMIVEIEGIPHIVKQFESKSPSSRGASTLYKVRFNNLQTHQKLDLSFKGDDLLKEADCIRVHVQYSYRDDDIFYFMNMEDYSQYGINAEQIENQIDYLVEQQEDITALIMDGNLLGIELPQSVNLTITDTPPAVTGSSATNRSKTATLSTGLEIQVPEYLAPGEEVKVNTVSGKFMSRA